MIARDSYVDMEGYNPATFDDTLYAAGDFQGDLLPDNALDRVWSDRFHTVTESGFNAAHVTAQCASAEGYAIVCIHNPAAGVSGYHFMVLGGVNLVADPWWGKWMTLAAWGGPSVVVKVLYIQTFRAELAAQAASAAAAAAAQARAAADAAAAQVAAQAAAEAAATAAAEQAAKDKAAADAAAAKAAADAAAKAAAAADSQPSGKVTPPTAAPKPDLWAYIQTFVILLVKSFQSGR